MIFLKNHIKKLTGFSLVGIVVTLVSLLLLYICNELLSFNLYLAYFISYFLSILLSYFLNACLVWKVCPSLGAIVKYFVIYLLSMLIGLGILYALESFLVEWNHTLISFLTVPFTMLWNYIFVNIILSK